MAAILLETKLSAPALVHDLVPRPNLKAKLDSGLNGKLILISAPAGFGKTTLVLSWLSQPPRITYSWLSLDRGDNDPNRFLDYLIAACQRHAPRVSQTVIPQLRSPQPPPLTTICTLLLNELAQSPSRIVLVLDDYHVIDNQEVDELVLFLMTNLPASCCLLLTTRVDPRFPLARLRGQGQLTEIREQALRLNMKEAAILLNDLMALDLPDESLRQLFIRTEGWAAGLHLAALALQDRPEEQKKSIIDQFSGSHMFIMDYLLEEVWLRLDAEVQEFLLETAVLDQLSGPLCDAVRQQSDSQIILEELHRKNLFVIPLDHERRWFRYHHLFSELLATYLRQKADPPEIQALHERASNWYEGQEMIEMAIDHGLKSADTDRAARLIETHARSIHKQGKLKTLLSWLDKLPPDVIQAHPRLQIYLGQALFLSGQMETAQKTLLEARHSLEARALAPEYESLRGELATQMAIIASLYDDTTKIVAEAEEALAYLPADDLANRARAISMLGVARGYEGDTDQLIASNQKAAQLAHAAGNPFLQAHALQLVGSTQLHQARLHEAAETFRQIIDMAPPQAISPPFYSGLGLIGLADVLLEWQDLEAAADHLDRGIELCRQGGIGYNLLNAFGSTLRLRQALDDDNGARQVLAQLKDDLSSHPALPLALVQLALFETRFLLWRGEVERAAHKLANPTPDDQPFLPARLPLVVREVYRVAQAHVHLAQSAFDQVLKIYRDVSATAVPAGRKARLLELSLLKAMAHYRGGEETAARQALKTALHLGEPEGYILIFLEHGSDMVDLLALFSQPAAETESLGRYAGEILAHVKPSVGSLGASLEGQRAAGDSAPLSRDLPPGFEDKLNPEALSAREMDVLRLLCTGYTNRQIAEELTVTLNTVKKHTSNIYGKLGVSNRTQAIACAHQLGLIQ